MWRHAAAAPRAKRHTSRSCIGAGLLEAAGLLDDENPHLDCLLVVVKNQRHQQVCQHAVSARGDARWSASVQPVAELVGIIGAHGEGWQGLRSQT